MKIRIEIVRVSLSMWGRNIKKLKFSFFISIHVIEFLCKIMCVSISLL